MTLLLTLTILILTGIALWQITKIFELSQLGRKKDDSQIATEKDNDLHGKLMFAFLVFIYIVTIYSFWTYSKVLLPESASAHGPAYDTLLWISFAIILFAQTITQAVLHVFAYKYRGINNRKAYFYTHNNTLEFVWTIIPAIIFFILIIYGMVTWGNIMNIEEDEDALVVELYAQQWNWKARYAGEDNVLGDANVRFLNDFDGRNTVEKHFDGSHKPMTIRFAEVTKDGEIINEYEIDSETCDCCQTSIISSEEGPIIVYRDRSKDEIRDIYIARNINGVWTQPKPVFNDGWVINGCPVNGPKADVNLSNIAVAWFTVVDGKPYTRLAFSNNYGETFDKPINLNDNDAIGRVDVAFLDDKQVIVSYMEFDGDYAFLKVKKVSVDGKVSKPFIVSKIDAGRNTGVPQLEIINNDVFLAWTTSVNGRNSLKTKKINSNSI